MIIHELNIEDQDADHCSWCFKAKFPVLLQEGMTVRVRLPFDESQEPEPTKLPAHSAVNTEAGEFDCECVVLDAPVFIEDDESKTDTVGFIASVNLRVQSIRGNGPGQWHFYPRARWMMKETGADVIPQLIASGEPHDS